MAEPARKMRIHFLVLDNEAGPIGSAPGGNNPAFPVQIGSASRWRCACSRDIKALGKYDRATSEPWGVRCDACKATEEFRKGDRPKPALHGAEGDLEADGAEFHGQQKAAGEAPKKGAPVGVKVKEGGCC